MVFISALMEYFKGAHNYVIWLHANFYTTPTNHYTFYYWLFYSNLTVKLLRKWNTLCDLFNIIWKIKLGFSTVTQNLQQEFFLVISINAQKENSQKPVLFCVSLTFLPASIIYTFCCPWHKAPIRKLIPYIFIVFT